jgi:predicted nuclease with TOPRIM domain
MLQRVGSQHGKKEKGHIGMTVDNLDYELPDLRAKIGALQAENNLLRQDLKDMTASYYSLLNRIKELSEEKLDNANIQIQK